MTRPTIGRIVHYVLPNGQHRAAIVVNAWSGSYQPQMCNLTVHLDQLNDTIGNDELAAFGARNGGYGTLIVGSAKQDEDTQAPGTWHWPERD